METKLRTLAAHEFVRRLKETTDAADRRYAFFLGAGCSRSSGIPAAGELVKRWLRRLRDLRNRDARDVDDWAKTQIDGYDPENPAASYGAVIAKLFLHPEERQREMEDLCDNQLPAFGYAVLASLVSIEEGRFNVVLTTNFDDLVPDALYLYTKARPLVIHHESLAGFIRPTRTRPLVVKLHGDHRLAPANTAEETQALKEQIEDKVLTTLADRGLIIIGYGGHDQGITAMLQHTPPDALPLGVYWVNKELPGADLLNWLEQREALWIKSANFDELMVLVRDTFDLPHPDKKRFDDVFKSYFDTYKELSGEVAEKKPAEADPEAEAETDALKAAVARTDRLFEDWMAVYLEAASYAKTDPDRTDEVFRAGIKQFPESEVLLGNYAQFLHANRQNPGRAEPFYKRAVELDPNDVHYRAAYAECLLACGRVGEGLAQLSEAMKRIDAKRESDLAAVCHFIGFAHQPAEQRPEELRNLKRLLIEGARWEGWDLSQTIARAREDGHPDGEWLEKLAAVINDKADIATLDDWPAWREA